MSTEIEQIYNGILEGDMETVSQNVKSALEKGEKPQTVMNAGLIAAMDEVGSLFEAGEFFVPEMLIAARAMKAGLEILKPKLLETDVQSTGKAVIGTVKGDLHDIGKNLVAIMLEGAGFEIIDLGVDIPPEKFVEAIRENDVDIVALSALLTTTMSSMGTTVKQIETAGLRESVKIMIGGAPVTQAYADEIGADGFASDAGSAVTLAKSLVA